MWFFEAIITIIITLLFYAFFVAICEVILEVIFGNICYRYYKTRRWEATLNKFKKILWFWFSPIVVICSLANNISRGLVGFYVTLRLILFSIEIIVRMNNRDQNWYDWKWYNEEWFDKDWYSESWLYKYTWTRYNEAWYDKNWFDKNWFDKNWLNWETWSKYDSRWYDKDWYNEKWYNRKWYNRYWYDKNWFDTCWWNKKWINKKTGTEYDENWYDRYWYDWKWYDEEWYDRYWYNKKWYNSAWYDKNWYKKDWYNIRWRNKKWINKKTGTRFDKDWYDEYWNDKDWYKKDWYDIFWRNKKWINKKTRTKFDEDWYDRYWYDKDWYNEDWYDKNWFTREIKEEITELDEDLQDLLLKWKEIWTILEKDLINSIDSMEWSLRKLEKFYNLCDELEIEVIPLKTKKNKKIEKTKKEISWKWKSSSIKICSIASWSNWNCYYIGTDDKAILIDDWISYKQLSSRMQQANLNINSIKWIFISHEHTDHIKWLPVFYKNHPKVPIYFNENAYHSVNSSNDPGVYKRWVINLEDKMINLDWFKIYPFRKKHDASYPLSFRVEYDWISIWIFTDIWEHSTTFQNHFKKCNAVFLEANHDVTMLRNCSRPKDVIDRIYATHFSNDNAYDMLDNYANKDLQLVIFVHISKDNNTSEKILNKFSKFKNKYKIDIASRYSVWQVYTVTN